MKNSYRIIALSILSVLIVSSSGICLEENSSQPDKKRVPIDASKSLEENRKLLDFYKQRNVAAGKMVVGMSKDTMEQTAPSGVKMGSLKPSSADEEFFITIDKAGYYADQVNMIEGMLPKKKTK